MFFLLRTTFWIGLVLLLLPIGTGSDEDAPSIGIVQVYMAAQSTFKDLGGFCDRNANACEMGGSVFTLVGLKAKEAARLTYNYLSDDGLSGRDATQVASITTAKEAIETIPFDDVAVGQLLPEMGNAVDEPIYSGTLTSADKQIPWQLDQGQRNTQITDNQNDGQNERQNPFARVTPTYKAPAFAVPLPRPNPLYSRGS
ncbi:DUF5330 domain-containing protein [Pseudovibrio sp. Tun.PSC04-5.I4]|uniref:DUF5330 domain-containing protein n=1 Tax=Pseudovibrio sp. Tun.PSC04-5.I4 TaxID=1798213 RepID=UPI0008861786|nr:DUF5330 domain-containing protein [Pseudovibrio sp. Tun.PSC04-5.I4]SDQ88450.1 hypothetical protein SAMN04515695_1767 [Pseudovibrio sp. Tun.PSC04-5.I4]